MGWIRAAAATFMVLLVLSGCAEKPKQPMPPVAAVTPTPPGLRTQRPYRVNGVWYYPLPSSEGYVEDGYASWYGKDFHGKKTSSGEVYDMHSVTAAHKTLPLGTWVKVTRLDSGDSAVIRVNDRGPFVSGRILDLSYGSAKVLGTVGKGIVPVRVEAVQAAREEIINNRSFWAVESVPDFKKGLFGVQVGAFRVSGNAQRLRERMTTAYGDARIIPVPVGSGDTIYRVQVGRFDDLAVAQGETTKLRGQGFPDAFVFAMEDKK